MNHAKFHFRFLVFTMKNFFSKQHKSGFTLLELTIASTIAIMVIGVALLTLKSTQSFFEVASVDHRLFNQTGSILDRIAEELKGSYWERIGITGNGTGVFYEKVLGWDTDSNKPLFDSKRWQFFWQKGKRELLFVVPSDNGDEGFAKSREVICSEVKEFRIQKIDTQNQEKIVIYIELNRRGEDSNREVVENLRKEVFIPREPRIK